MKFKQSEKFRCDNPLKVIQCKSHVTEVEQPTSPIQQNSQQVRRHQENQDQEPIRVEIPFVYHNKFPDIRFAQASIAHLIRKVGAGRNFKIAYFYVTKQNFGNGVLGKVYLGEVAAADAADGKVDFEAIRRQGQHELERLVDDADSVKLVLLELQILLKANYDILYSL